MRLWWRGAGRVRRNDRGQAAGFESLPFGVLVFVSMTLLAVNAWKVVDTRSAVDGAAREYLRAYTAAPDVVSARELGDRAARRSIGARVALAEVASIEAPGGVFGPCRPAEVTVAVRVPAVRIPFFATWGEMTVAATEVELVQPFGPAGGGEIGLEGTPCET